MLRLEPDQKLIDFYSGLNSSELIQKISQSHKYQQQVLFNAHRGKQPVEKYIAALLNSQSNVMMMIELVIKKSIEEINKNG